ncbi:hypothetical protein JSO59_008670 [Riemerella anatipestifer]|uniref:hypothetical protein n=1 Tax=Riemerella anatipestifer TaxID=34085 RepID=UPI0030EE0675
MDKTSVEKKYFKSPFLVWWLFLSVQMFSQIHVQGGATVIDYTDEKNNDTKVKIVKNIPRKSIKQKFSKKTPNNKYKTISNKNAKENNIRSNIVKNCFESKVTPNHSYFSRDNVDSKKGFFWGVLIFLRIYRVSFPLIE